MMKEKSGACCDLSLLLGGSLCALVWYTYGCLLDDANISVSKIWYLITQIQVYKRQYETYPVSLGAL